MFVSYKVIIKNLLFGLILLFLFLPIIQEEFELVELKPLEGSFIEIDKPNFKWEYWNAGIYQSEQSKYIDENIGFRNFFIRLNNQINFSLYKRAKANGVIVGKEDMLFEYHYIDSYLGKDFAGEKEIKLKLKKLKVVRDSLARKGIHLLIVFSPSKGRYFSEYIPDHYFKDLKRVSNYEYYRAKFLQSDFSFIDFNHYFIEQKEVSPYPLFPKNGIHWSRYGEIIALDSILTYLETKNLKRNLGEMKIESIWTTDSIGFNDEDIEKGMNLLYDLPDFKMAYPELSFSDDSTRNQAKVLTISDSFFWGLFGSGVSGRVFNHGDFWYYNQEVFRGDGSYALIKDINSKEEAEKNDVIILMMTEMNLGNLGFEFVENMYKEYQKNIIENGQTRNDRIQNYIKAIENTPEWLNSVKKQAHKENIPLEEALLKNAEYMVNQDELEE